MKDALWFLVEVLLGLLLAGGVAPLVLMVLPAAFRGTGVLALVAVTCVLAVIGLRRLASKSDERRPTCNR
jgi:hypothetical protein